MNIMKYAALLSTLALAFSLNAFARDKNQHSVTLNDPVQVGQTQLKPGDYKVQWEGTGPNTQVNFLKNGKTVATAPATLKTNDSDVIQDSIILSDTSTKAKELRELDFSHDKEALIFGSSGM